MNIRERFNNIDKDKKMIIFGIILVGLFALGSSKLKAFFGEEEQLPGLVVPSVVDIENQMIVDSTKLNYSKADRIDNMEYNKTTPDRNFYSIAYQDTTSIGKVEPTEVRESKVTNFEKPNFSEILDTEKQVTTEKDLYKGVNMSFRNNKSNESYIEDTNYEVPNSSITSVVDKEDHSNEIQEEEEESIQTWTAPDIGTGPTANSFDTSGETTQTEIAATIVGTTLKKDKVTPQNPRVYIQTLESFFVQGVKIPKGKRLIAYATFGQELELNIKSITHNGQILKCNFGVWDNGGQSGLDRHGKSGFSDSAGDISQEVGDDIAANSEVQKVPGSQGIIKKIFKKNDFAYATRDRVIIKAKKP